MVVLEVADGHPEEPSPQGLQTLELLGNGECRADLARASEKANEVLDLSRVLLVMLEMRLNLLNLHERALISLEIFRSRGRGSVVLSRGGWRSGECAALCDEVSKLGFVLPRVHGINDLQKC